MDPISSVSSIYATSALTAATLKDVRWWINASKRRPKVLEDLDVCLETLAARLAELALLFQNRAGDLGTGIMLAMSTSLDDIRTGLEQILDVLSDMRLIMMPARDVKTQPREDSMIELEKPLNELLLELNPLSALVKTIHAVPERRNVYV